MLPVYKNPFKKNMRIIIIMLYKNRNYTIRGNTVCVDRNSFEYVELLFLVGRYLWKVFDRFEPFSNELAHVSDENDACRKTQCERSPPQAEFFGIYRYTNMNFYHSWRVRKFAGRIPIYRFCRFKSNVWCSTFFVYHSLYKNIGVFFHFSDVVYRICHTKISDIFFSISFLDS